MAIVPARLYPAPVSANGTSQQNDSFATWELLFHLNLRNRSTQQLTLRRLVIAGVDTAGTHLWRHTLEQPTLAQQLRPLAWIVMKNRQQFAAAHRLANHFRQRVGRAVLDPNDQASLLFITLLLKGKELPHRLELSLHHNNGTSRLEVPLARHRQRTRLSLPFRGYWSAISGHRYFEHHATLHLPSQRFAYDLVRVRERGLTYDGNPRRNESYLAYSRPVLAAADGTVVAVQGDVPDNPPGQRPGWKRFVHRPRSMAGNYVVIDHGHGEFTAYLHLKPKPLVQLNQTVRRGTVIGRCGNSGNSAEPHIHIQLQDGPDPMHANGLPALFSSFSFQYGQLLNRVFGQPQPLPLRLPLAPIPVTGKNSN